MLGDSRGLKSSSDGFSLLELVAVLVILAVMSSIVVLKLGNGSKWSVEACKAHWNLINSANIQYVSDQVIPDDSLQTNEDTKNRNIPLAITYYDLKTLVSKGYFQDDQSGASSVALTGVSLSRNCNLSLINGIIYLIGSSGQKIAINNPNLISSTSSLEDLLSGKDRPTINEPVGGFTIQGNGSGTISGTLLDQATAVYFLQSNETWPGRAANISPTSTSTSLVFNAASRVYSGARMIVVFQDGSFWTSSYLYTFG